MEQMAVAVSPVANISAFFQGGCPHRVLVGHGGPERRGAHQLAEPGQREPIVSRS
jgi:hypothetical protein